MSEDEENEENKEQKDDIIDIQNELKPPGIKSDSSKTRKGSILQSLGSKIAKMTGSNSNSVNVTPLSAF